MATPRARTVAAVLGLLAVAAIAGSLGHPAVIERWHIWRLDSEDEAVRRAAAEALGKRRSVRAIPRLFGLLTCTGSESDRVLDELTIEAYMGVKGQLTEMARLSNAKRRMVLREFREQIIRSQLPNAFALDALIEIGQPALDYAESLNVQPDDVRTRYVVDEVQESIGSRQEQDEP